MNTSSLLLFIVAKLLSFFYEANGQRNSWYGYHIHDPSQWGQKYKHCNDSHDQSPIDIVTRETVYDPILSDPVLHGGWQNVPTSVLMLQNTGHTMQLLFRDRHIRMHGAHLTHEFYLKQCHFHWGESEFEPGSEHWIDGRQFDAEMHCVFIDIDFIDGTEASTYDREAWAVFAVFIKFDSEQPNPYIDYLLSHTDAIQQAGEQYNFTQEENKADIRHLLPSDLSRYYRYQGSLTSPPCYEFVVWTIFEEPIHISQQQARKLFVLHNAIVEQSVGFVNITGNFRPPQALAGRTVYRSFKTYNQKSSLARATTSKKETILQLLAGFTTILLAMNWSNL